MNLLVVSESRGDAVRQSASVLDRYLPRIGHRTWLGEISAEGVEDLRATLRKGATRATAVAAHRMTGGRKTGLAFVVGNRALFGPAGEVPVSWTQRRPSRPDRTSLERLLVAAVGMGSGLHDIGKLTVGFNRVLCDAVLGRATSVQPVRHELLSVLVLHAAIERHGRSCDIEFLEAVATPEGASSVFAKALDALPRIKNWARDDKNDEIAPFLPDRKTHPVMRAVADLIVSHHKLPRGFLQPSSACRFADGAAYSYVIKDHRHVGARHAKAHLPWVDFCTPAPAAAKCLSAPGTRWDIAFAADAGRALSVLRETPAFSKRGWIGAGYHYGRLALMLGDHQGSKAKVSRPTSATKVETVASEWCFANTKRESGSSEADQRDDFGRAEHGFSDETAFDEPAKEAGIHLADTWDQHTHKVRRRALAALGHLLSPRDWPAVVPDEMPRILIEREPNGSPFVWQDRAAEVIKASPKAGAWLVFLPASTGTGKTVAIPKIAAAISGESGLRLNMALGLRSLTLQTGDEYIRRIGFSHDQAVVAVGSSTAQMLHELAQYREEADFIQEGGCDDIGSDAIQENADDLVLGGNLDTGINKLAQRTASLDENKSKRWRLLATPILVSTIDRLMSAADARGGGHLGDNLRVTSADLALDELDSFDAEALIAITRLVRIAAASGRSVIIASATIRRGHAALIRRAFAAGRQNHAALDGGDPSFGVAWASEHLAETAVDCGRDDPDSREWFSARHREVAAKMAEMVSKTPVRRRVEFFEIAKGATPIEHFEVAFSATMRLHGGNHVVDPATGVRVSVGFVRWNHVRAARAFAAYVATAKAPTGTAIAFACYHSKFATAVRAAIYGPIDGMLKRKCQEGELDPLLVNNPDHGDIRKHLEHAATSGCADLVCIISTTNIIEVGCDLDADWGVTEPCSERSLLQFAGRIRRHRYWLHETPNVAVLERVMPTPGDQDTRISYPGIETPMGLGPKMGQFGPDISNKRSAKELFPVEAWKARIDNARCLTDASSLCASAEISMLEGACLGETEAIKKLRVQKGANAGRPEPPNAGLLRGLSVASLAELPDILWTDIHPRARQLRRQDGMQAVDIAKIGGKWLLRDGVSIESAKATHQTKWRAEWSEPGPRVSGDYPELENDPTAKRRLLLSTEVYNVETASTSVEEKMAERGRPITDWIGRELRTASLQLPVSERCPGVTVQPWLGMDTA